MDTSTTQRRHRLLSSLRLRVVLAITAMLIPLAVLAGLGYVYFVNSLRTLDGAVESLFDDLHVVTELQYQLRRVPVLHRRLQLDPTPEAGAALALLAADVDTLFDQSRATGLARLHGRAGLEQAAATWASLRPRLEPDAATSPGDVTAAVDTVLRQLGEFESTVHKATRTGLYRALQNHKDAVLVIAAVAFFGFLFALTAGGLLYLAVFEPLRRLRRGAERIMSGELDHRVESADPGELGRLADGYNCMAGMLRSSQNTVQLHTIHDSLTGLINRREFKARFDTELERARRYAQPFALLMVDVDGLGRLNEELGHLAGDEALRILAVTLSRLVRPVDIVARFGNDEFVIVMPDIGVDDALATAHRLRRHIAGQGLILASGMPARRITVSIGLAVYPDDGDAVEPLVACAAAALDEAKALGGDTVAGGQQPETASGGA